MCVLETFLHHSCYITLENCVEFDALEYTVSESSGSLEVILLLLGDTNSEPFNVTVIANDTGASSALDKLTHTYTHTHTHTHTHTQAV